MSSARIVQPRYIVDEDGNIYDATNPMPTADNALEMASGRATGKVSVNKFGYAPSGVQTTATDIWDRADATPTQQIWIAPLFTPVTIRIKSTSASDSFGNVGASLLRVWGLTSWDSKETYEDIQLAATVEVNTVNQYLIIHRMSVIEYGIVGVNLGTITARFSVATIIAQINIGWGQTEMAIYGIPSIQTAYLTNWYASVQKSSGVAADVNFRLLYSQDPASSASLFVTKEIRGLQSTGSSNGLWSHSPYKKFIGPGILKVQAIASSADIDCTAGFDLILEDN